MKTVVLWVLLVSGTWAQALELRCEWQKTPELLSGYFRPASFEISYDSLAVDSPVKISRGTYFQRVYQPCYVGSSAHCEFRFGEEPDTDYSVEANRKGESFDLARFSNLGAYMYLEMIFKKVKPYRSFAVGEKTQLTMFGDDGDGSKIYEEQFICTRVR